MIPSDIAIDIDDDDFEENGQSSLERRESIKTDTEECKISIVIPVTTEDESKPSTSSAEPHSSQNPLEIAIKLTRDSRLTSLEDLDQQLTQEQIMLFQEFVRIQSRTKVTTTEIAVGSNVLDVHTEIPDVSLYPPPPYASHENSRQIYMQHSTTYSGPAPSYSEMYVTFTSERLRNQFVRKVYSILSIQLMITFGFVLLTVLYEPVKTFVSKTPVLPYLSMATLVGLLILLSCSVPMRRHYPLNAILLLIFTLAFTYTMAYVACQYSDKAVLYATGGTAIVCSSIMILAWLNFFDITTWKFFLMAAFLIVILVGVVMTVIFSFVGGSQVFSIIFGLVMTVFFSIYLLYDTQKLLGGGRIALSEEEYILGAISLYVDIMLIFNYIMLLCLRR
ncbi:protein lifeguard 2-like [Diabrotica virgifera virgifera]|uniref:Protein lifeguard 2-like n=1 Tax=Diabrotica virgifera virgifera TaxID=50390 RepID=A0A6P7GRT8_DIAVI|nr:protein lifeguard 2-like [Diabrotica virgifera virgifera]